MTDRGHTGGVTVEVSSHERQVGSHLAFDVADGGVTLVLQVAPAASWEVEDEEIDVRVDGAPVAGPVTEVADLHGTRVHVVRAQAGALTVDYRCRTRPSAPPAGRGPEDVLDAEALTYLRQSRYAPSDELLGFATAELGHVRADADGSAAVAAWVFERFAYTPGSSGPLDTAVDTLLSGAGVCRDYAHVTIALCRALEIPARLVSVYAPGLSPMDFHAVVEVRVDGRWQVLDPTRLAPRPGLVRIATGRDAADTALVTTLAGEAELTESEVWAVIDGDLPADDHVTPMPLP
jgi:transglutaminase-like putative cysteine protease